MSYIQVVPLYLGEDQEVSEYFRKWKQDIDAITSEWLIIAVPTTVSAGDAPDIVSAIASERYPGLCVDDLPCLWVESRGGQFKIKLKDNRDAVKESIRVLSECARTSGDFAAVQDCFMTKDPNAPPSTPSRIPQWFPIAGYSALAVTLLFFMAMLVAGIAGHPIPDPMRMIVVFILAIGVAMASSFLGGDAAAKGSLPFSFATRRPIAFSVTGGVAVFFIVLIFGYYLYARV
jgi:hypothetical protein